MILDGNGSMGEMSIANGIYVGKYERKLYYMEINMTIIAKRKEVNELLL